jgi:hypothetical protein
MEILEASSPGLGALGGFTQNQITQALPKAKNNAILNI